MVKRLSEHQAEEALSDTPVVLIVGPRRAGKTTLVKKMQVALSQLTEDMGKDLFAGKPMTITRPKPRTVLEQVSLGLAIAALSEELNRRWHCVGQRKEGWIFLPSAADLRVNDEVEIRGYTANESLSLNNNKLPRHPQGHNLVANARCTDWRQ